MAVNKSTNYEVYKVIFIAYNNTENRKTPPTICVDLKR